MLTIHYLPYTRIRLMKSIERIELILSLLKSDRIIIIDGRLNSKDETALIRETMSRIDDNFNGVELAVLSENERKDNLSKLKHDIANSITGRLPGLTIIGPASILSEMRKNPEDVVLNFGDGYLKKHTKNIKNTRKIIGAVNYYNSNKEGVVTNVVKNGVKKCIKTSMVKDGR
jgi:hypothetical protein